MFGFDWEKNHILRLEVGLFSHKGRMYKSRIRQAKNLWMSWTNGWYFHIRLEFQKTMHLHNQYKFYNFLSLNWEIEYEIKWFSTKTEIWSGKKWFLFTRTETFVRHCMLCVILISNLLPLLSVYPKLLPNLSPQH